MGRTEKIIGTWLKARKNRDKVILVTKIAGRSPMNWLRDDKSATDIYETLETLTKIVKPGKSNP